MTSIFLLMEGNLKIKNKTIQPKTKKIKQIYNKTMQFNSAPNAIKQSIVVAPLQITLSLFSPKG